jgi:hypothetical protein
MNMWIDGPPQAVDGDGEVWWVQYRTLSHRVYVSRVCLYQGEWLIPGTPSCVDHEIIAHATYTTGVPHPPLPALRADRRGVVPDEVGVLGRRTSQGLPGI